MKIRSSRTGSNSLRLLRRPFLSFARENEWDCDQRFAWPLRLPERPGQPQASRPWNPIIAQAFYRRGIIETWGRGTLRMAELTAEAGLVPPEIEVVAGEVLVRFRPARRIPEPRRGPELTALQQELLQILSAAGTATLAQIRVALPQPVPERTVQRQLGQLREMGLAELAGKGRGGRWTLKSATE